MTETQHDDMGADLTQKLLGLVIARHQVRAIQISLRQPPMALHLSQTLILQTQLNHELMVMILQARTQVP
jgi:hypothetical protein